MDPADFYTGLVAELYAPLKVGRPDPGRYARFIGESGEPALELGCGDGDPLLALRAMGLDVDGIDSSADMLDRCRRAASVQGVDVVLYQRTMEELDLPRRYRSIFLAGPTFTLLPDDDTALRALRGIRAHLDPGGTALVPLFIPGPTPADRLGHAREATAADGSVLRVAAVSEDRDETARVQRTVLRYERHSGGQSTVVDRSWTLHWHTRDGFGALATAAGLATVAVRDGTGRAAAADAREFTYWLRAA